MINKIKAMLFGPSGATPFPIEGHFVVPGPNALGPTGPCSQGCCPGAPSNMAASVASASPAKGITGTAPSEEPGVLTMADLEEAWLKLCAARFELYPNRQVQPAYEPFIWETNDGVCLSVKEMATPHLFFALRMIYNHSVPPAFRVGEFRQRPEVCEWPVEYRAQACSAFTEELEQRDDLEPVLKHQFDDLLANADFLQAVKDNVGATGPMGEPGISEQGLRDILEEYCRRDAELSTAQSMRDLDTRMGEAIDTSARDMIDRRRDLAKAKRMRKAVPKGRGLLRCMEHRSYAGIRKPRVECKACAQVYRARQRRYKEAEKL